MKPSTMDKKNGKRRSTKIARFALLTLGAKKAAELWQSRQQPPPPSTMQRLAIPARVLLGAVGIGGAAYYANKKGMLTQVKQKVMGRWGTDQESRPFTGPNAEVDVVEPIQPAEPPPVIVDTHPTATVPPEPPGSTL